MKNIIIITTATFALFISSCATSSTTGNSGTKSYTSDKCIVTDNKLGSMGDPVTKVYNGQEVKFCCNPCVKKFYAAPEKYLSKLN